MNKRYFCVIGLSLAVMSASAQKPVSEAESESMVQQVCLAAEKMRSLECDFKQVKQLSLLKSSMVSEGKMYYKDGRFLRWEYTSPYSDIFILNEGKVLLKSSDKTDVVDVRSSKMFQQIARIMMNSVTGKCLEDSEDFKVTMYLDENQWMAQLVPRQKELAQLFSFVRLYIDPSMQMVKRVELVEKSGDITRIDMKNIQRNKTIDDAVFSVK